MKKFYPAFIFVFASLAINAQLTEANHAPASGEQYSTWNCDSVNPGLSGANVLWDFSAVATHSSTVKVHIASAVSSATYANATIAVGSSITDIAYYKSNANELLYYGGNLPIPNYSVSINYTSAPAVYAAYPMSLNTTSTAVIGGSINVTSPTAISGPFTGNCRVIADGTGTLILPGGVTYSNVMRVLNSQTISATILIPVIVTQETYDYYAIGIKAPIFSIATTTFAPSFGSPTTQTLVTRNKDANGSITTSIEKNGNLEFVVSVFPNPASSELTLMSTNDNAMHALLFDLSGKIIEKAQMQNGKVQFDVSAYENGLYFYSITDENNEVMGRGKVAVVK